MILTARYDSKDVDAVYRRRDGRELMAAPPDERAAGPDPTLMHRLAEVTPEEARAFARANDLPVDGW